MKLTESRFDVQIARLDPARCTALVYLFGILNMWSFTPLTNWNNKYIVCIGVSTPLKNIPTLFRQAPPLNLQTAQATHFYAIHPYILVLYESSLKNRIFQWTPIILKIFILNPIIKFLVKIFQFKLLVMTEKHFYL